MCGICGVIDWTESPDPAALVRRMTPAMRHRGPDDEGYLDGERFSIGMRRLSIIDIEGGHQPIFNEDGLVGVVLNGEIYNFRELTGELKALGHQFRTRSDSEVVAHAYEEWGPDCVRRLEGMFAIAVWDRRVKGRSQESEVEAHGARGDDRRGGEGTLFLARDRLGIKPLYYYAGTGEGRGARGKTPDSKFEIRNSKFLFASEVRTLLASGVVPRQLSRSALHSYLLFGSVSEPVTLVEGVYSLPPAHSLTIALDQPPAALNPERYWNITTAAAQRNGRQQLDETQTKARVRELLAASVHSHLVADVPVGIFLSGGIDSTALAALASRAASGVHTFTVAFPEAEFSEAVTARRTAERFGTTHQEFMLSGEEVLARLDEAVSALDQPTMDGINSYFVSWAAAQAGLKVALSGLGGDELFGGYKSTFLRTPQYSRLAAASSHVPGPLRTVMSAAISGAGLARGDAARKIAALWHDSSSLPHPYYFARALFTPLQVAQLMSGPQTEGETRWWSWLNEGAEQVRLLDDFAAVTCLEARSYLVNTLLRDTDSMSMANSLEVRVPFLHHPLVEFVARLPAEVKVGDGTPKALLVAALGDLLPPEVAQQTKRGFTFPWQQWLRGPLKEKVAEGLSALTPALRQALNEEEVRNVWKSYLNGKTSWSRPWSLYVLNEWVKRNL